MTRYEHVTLEQGHVATEALELIRSGQPKAAIDLLVGWGFDVGSVFEQSDAADSDSSYTTDDYHLTWSDNHIRLERFVK